MENNELKMLVGSDENIFWEGKPERKCYVLKSIFNVMLPFVVVWTGFDGIFIKAIFSGEMADSGIPTAFALLFIMLHMTPVWIYIGGILTSGIRYKNAYYIVTDKAVYISSGIFAANTEVKMLSDITNVGFTRGLIEKNTGTGNILLNGHTDYPVRGNSRTRSGFEIKSIKDYERVLKLIKDLQIDL
ncbi:MAG: PH domain-containing protein [Lachnospiraceae bacterium]|nr:PH domain-containing protein [Lachnospiraceae bacterium]